MWAQRGACFTGTGRPGCQDTRSLPGLRSDIWPRPAAPRGLLVLSSSQEVPGNVTEKSALPLISGLTSCGRWACQGIKENRLHVLRPGSLPCSGREALADVPAGSSVFSFLGMLLRNRSFWNEANSPVLPRNMWRHSGSRSDPAGKPVYEQVPAWWCVPTAVCP